MTLTPWSPASADVEAAARLIAARSLPVRDWETLPAQYRDDFASSAVRWLTDLHARGWRDAEEVASIEKECAHCGGTGYIQARNSIAPEMNPGKLLPLHSDPVPCLHCKDGELVAEMEEVKRLRADRAAEPGREAERCQTHGAKIIGPCGMCGAPQCCPVCCEIAREQGKRMTAEEQRDKLAKFKAYVHKRLDTEGVPENPEPAATAKHGCRIGERFDWLFARLRAPAVPQQQQGGQGKDAAVRELLHLADRAEACSGERPSPSHIGDFRDIARGIRDEVGALLRKATPAPPRADDPQEREALAKIIDDNRWAPLEGGVVRRTGPRELANAILAAGFRRVAPEPGREARYEVRPATGPNAHVGTWFYHERARAEDCAAIVQKHTGVAHYVAEIARAQLVPQQQGGEGGQR